MDDKVDASQIKNIPTKEIFADHDFNCRGFIDGRQVVDLARSIEEHGLLQPIIVQPFVKEDDKDIKYRIVAGYRRYTACRVNKMKEIPCIVKADLTEDQARILNLSENLKRKDLNMLQEAKAIEPFILKGYVEAEICEKVGMSRGWVQIRVMILQLEEPIQEEIAAGILNSTNIRHLHMLKDAQKRFDYVKEVKKLKLSGKKKIEVNLHKIKKTGNSKRERKREEILDMVELIVQWCGGGSLATIALAWAGANVDDLTLYQKIREEAAKNNKYFPIPIHIVNSAAAQLYRPVQAPFEKIGEIRERTTA